jgi:hypothetical protein
MYRDLVHFVVVDLNHASSAQQRLASKYYPGYIPTLAIFDKSGNPGAWFTTAPERQRQTAVTPSIYRN